MPPRSSARSDDPERCKLKVATWNINSVRLRIDLVARFLRPRGPTCCACRNQCPDDKFPFKRFERLGYEHVALNGQKGYHGVAVVSRLPFDASDIAELLRQDRLPAHHGDAGREGRLREPIDAA